LIDWVNGTSAENWPFRALTWLLAVRCLSYSRGHQRLKNNLNIQMRRRKHINAFIHFKNGPWAKSAVEANQPKQNIIQLKNSCRNLVTI